MTLLEEFEEWLKAHDEWDEGYVVHAALKKLEELKEKYNCPQ